MNAKDTTTVLLASKPANVSRPLLLAMFCLLLILVVSACAGGEDSPADAPDVSSESSSDGSDSIPKATVLIGDETYEFSEEGLGATFNCTTNYDGTFEALLRLVDDSGEVVPLSEFRLVLLHEGAEPERANNSIFINFGNLRESADLNYTPGWSADAEYADQEGWPAGSSQVNSYTIDGQSASGTATFVTNQSSDEFLRGNSETVESVQGSFSVACDGSDVTPPPIDSAANVSPQPPVGSDGEEAVTETATVTFESGTYVFEESLGCTVDTGANTPVLAEFAVDGDRFEGDHINVRADQFRDETRVDLRIGNDSWIQVSGPYPVINGGTATWDSIELGSLDGSGSEVVSITISC